MTMSDTRNLLHRLWTKAASAADYDESEWMALWRALIDLRAQAEQLTQEKPCHDDD